jgi:hypothetical protein
MKKMVLTEILLILSTLSLLTAQYNQPDISASLEKLYGRLKINYYSSERLAINDSIRVIIESYAASDTVFNHRFRNLRYLGQVTSPDSVLKIITWNLILEDGNNRYFCYLIRRLQKTAPVKVYNLTGSYREIPVRTDTIYSPSDWYGALYYDIRPFQLNDQINYVILGIDYGNSFITRKIIDVLSFDSIGELVFGMKCFNDGKETKFRIVFEFASTAVMSLRFNKDSSIVFDHLAPFSTEYKDNRQFYGPDFSYDSYDFESSMWRFKTNVDVRNKE